MNGNWKNRLAVVLVATVVVVALIAMARTLPLQAAGEATQASSIRYVVVESEGHNLIVTDNQTNTLYFYTIDKDKEIGSDLKLRGSIDLNQVGKPSIKPTKGAAEK